MQFMVSALQRHLQIHVTSLPEKGARLRKKITLAVVVPLGPTEHASLAHVFDTLESIQHFATHDRGMIVIDSSGEALAETIHRRFPEIVVITSPQTYRLSGELYKALSLGFLYAQALWDFDVLLRMDTDALLIGPDLERDALDYLAAHPQVGLFGTYRVGASGEVSEFSWPQQQLQHETSVLGHLQDWQRARMLSSLVRQAQANGYALGEHVLGGGYFLSAKAVQMLNHNGWLLREELSRSQLQEDHLLGLLMRAGGLELGDFDGPEHPVAVRWRGLPLSPHDLVKRRKKLIHSTRFWQEEDEDAIRAFFRDHRQVG